MSVAARLLVAVAILIFADGFDLGMHKDARIHPNKSSKGTFCKDSTLKLGGSGRTSLGRRNFLGGGTAAASAAAAVAALGASPARVLAAPASPIVFGDESLMAPKAHGSTATAVQSHLRYGVSGPLADRICSFNRRWAEPGGSWEASPLAAAMQASGGPTTFHDSVTGKPLFVAPGPGRTVADFLAESATHGWPSFRDSEVVWENVRVLKDGEAVSVDGTHLGHNLPDRAGNRYCINLVSIAGQPAAA